MEELIIMFEWYQADYLIAAYQLQFIREIISTVCLIFILILLIIYFIKEVRDL